MQLGSKEGGRVGEGGTSRYCCMVDIGHIHHGSMSGCLTSSEENGS